MEPKRSATAIWDAIHPHLTDDEFWARQLPEAAAQIREVLLDKYQDTERALAKSKSERNAFQQQCHAEGPAGRTSWFTSIPEYEDRRRRQRGFQTLISRRLRQMTRLAKQASTHVNEQNSENRQALRKLATGVARHQQETIDPSPADARLWDLLDELWIPLGAGEANLTAMLEDVWSDDST